MSGLQLRPVDTPDGMLTAEHVRDRLNRPARDLLQDSVIAVENTHMDAGGRPVPVSLLASLREIADSRGLGIHVDGARLWNASEATGVDFTDLAEHGDTVMVSLSKALGAPVGSMLAGSRRIIDDAWHVRRRFGGGMRQAGILAAAGLYALEQHLEGLSRDHEIARILAEGVRAISGLDAALPDTNIVFLEIGRTGLDADSLLKFLENRRILMSKFGQRRLRAVTHLDVDQPGIARTLAALADAVVQT